MRPVALLLRGIGFSLALFAAAPSFAQTPPESEVPKEEEKKPEKGGGGKVIKLQGISVYGRVRKPEAFYILQRATLSYPEVELKKSFLGKVVESVEENPTF